jgi:hypothetical protein
MEEVQEEESTKVSFFEAHLKQLIREGLISTILCQLSQTAPPTVLESYVTPRGVSPMIFHELLVVACIATAPGQCEDVIINANPPWMDLRSCEAVGKRMIEKLGGSYECTPYRIPADAM